MSQKFSSKLLYHLWASVSLSGEWVVWGWWWKHFTDCKVVQKCSSRLSSWGDAEIMSDHAAPVLETLQHLPISDQRPEAGPYFKAPPLTVTSWTSHPPLFQPQGPLCSVLSLTGMFPLGAYALAVPCFLCKNVLSPGATQLPLFLPSGVLSRFWFSVRTSLATYLKDPPFLQTSYFPPFLYFFSLAFNLVYLFQYLPTRFPEEHTQRTLPARMF